jgi:tellurite resistance protein TerC
LVNKGEIVNGTWLWPIFGVIVILALFLDLFVFQRKAHVIPVKEALKLVGFWVGLAFIFDLLLYFTMGWDKAVLFTTAYLIEYSLSIDNLFVFLAIFTYFAVPREAQRKVLLWGIFGAIVFRGIFIFAGIGLIYTSIKLMTQKEKEIEPEKNPVVRFARKIIRVTPEYEGATFFTKKNGMRFATPLIIVLITIETMDIMFATDSVPAVLAVTLNPLIVYSSSIFAILGLRALFFALSGLFYSISYLSTGVCIVLIFVGVKMLLSDIVKIPTLISLGAVLVILAGSIILSVSIPQKKSE